MPRRSDVAEDVATANILSRDDCESGKMGIQSFDTMAMIDNHFPAVPGAHAGLEDDTVRGCPHRVALAGCNINPGMERAFALKRIQAGSRRNW